MTVPPGAGRASYNGGPGGIALKPTPEQERLTAEAARAADPASGDPGAHRQHGGDAVQFGQQGQACGRRDQRPGELKGPGAVPAKAAGTAEVRPAQAPNAVPAPNGEQKLRPGEKPPGAGNEPARAPGTGAPVQQQKLSSEREAGHANRDGAEREAEQSAGKAGRGKSARRTAEAAGGEGARRPAEASGREGARPPRSQAEAPPQRRQKAPGGAQKPEEKAPGGPPKPEGAGKPARPEAAPSRAAKMPEARPAATAPGAERPRPEAQGSARRSRTQAAAARRPRARVRQARPAALPMTAFAGRFGAPLRTSRSPALPPRPESG